MPKTPTASKVADKDELDVNRHHGLILFPCAAWHRSKLDVAMQSSSEPRAFEKPSRVSFSQHETLFGRAHLCTVDLIGEGYTVLCQQICGSLLIHPTELRHCTSRVHIQIAQAVSPRNT